MGNQRARPRNRRHLCDVLLVSALSVCVSTIAIGAYCSVHSLYTLQEKSLERHTIGTIACDGHEWLCVQMPLKRRRQQQQVALSVALTLLVLSDRLGRTRVSLFLTTLGKRNRRRRRRNGDKIPDVCKCNHAVTDSALNQQSFLDTCLDRTCVVLFWCMSKDQCDESDDT